MHDHVRLALGVHGVLAANPAEQAELKKEQEEKLLFKLAGDLARTV